MRFSLTAAAAALLGTAQAHINGISVPATIKPGEPFNVIVECSNWIQSSYDGGLIFGYAPGDGYFEAIGIPTDSYLLGSKYSNQVRPFNRTMTVPSSAAKGKAVISASLQTLVGAGDAPTLAFFNVSVTFGSSTSKTYKSSS